MAHTYLSTQTKVALIGNEVEYVHVPEPWDYAAFFRQRWEEGQSFINVEHDVIPWPGALQALAACGRAWCGYNYHLKCHQGLEDPNLTLGVPLGCVKLSETLIRATPGLWDQRVEWTVCDTHLTQAAYQAGIRFHQHFPGVVNANPALLYQTEPVPTESLLGAG